MGERLAEEAPVDADLVLPIPDSGTPAAIGFSRALKIPFSEGLIKNRYVGRTFIQPDQALRERGVKLKFNVLRSVLEGKRVVVVDDSIVRGSTTRKLVTMLFEAGAKEVHLRISSPPTLRRQRRRTRSTRRPRMLESTGTGARVKSNASIATIQPSPRVYGGSPGSGRADTRTDPLSEQTEVLRRMPRRSSLSETWR
jgi:hypothetical protein